MDPPVRDAATDASAGRKVDVSYRVGRAGRADRACRGSAVRDVHPRTFVRAAGNEGHGFQRARGAARSTCDQLLDEPRHEALEVLDAAEGGQWSRPPAFPSGGGGLVSTVDDYLAFGQMMLNRGTHGSVRILSRSSVETMTTDQLTREQKAQSGLLPGYFDSHGWGFGVAMVARREDLAGSIRTVRLGRWSRHLLGFGPAGGVGRHPADPARLDLAKSSRRVPRFLDLSLPGDRRLKPRSISSQRGEQCK